jgi:hypothetical protein
MKNQHILFAFLSLFLLLGIYGCHYDLTGDSPNPDPDPDPCENVICYNGGVCVNGDCDCPPGFIGANCQTELAPEYMRITGVSLNKWPEKRRSGENWDLQVGHFNNTTTPDIFFEFQKNGVSIGKTDHYSNCTLSGSPYEYSGFSYTVPVSAEILVKIWDYDKNQFDGYINDEMTSAKFVPLDWSSGLKDKLSISKGNPGFAFDLHVEWLF